MARCLCFSRGSKTWIALIVPILALFARFSSFHGVLVICIPFAVLLILLPTLFLSKHSNQKPTIADDSSPPQEENALISSSSDEAGGIAAVDQEETDAGAQERKVVEENGQGFLSRSSQDLYSESESMDRCSSTSSEDHSSDIEWPYNVGQSADCSDDAISDEESLIEIAIPSGHSVEDPKLMNLKHCKVSADFPQQEATSHKDFLADVNEDNLIEIDIYMGSIKCSSFDL